MERKIEARLVSDLIPRSNNPRTHSKKQIRQIARSIERFGFVTPILVDAEDRIIAGHGRVEAAKSIGLKEVPTLRITHMGPAEIRAYVIADNKLAENAGWDEALLALELKELSLEDDFDLTDIGFETAEIDLLLQQDVVESDKADEIPTIDPSVAPVSRRGDLWKIGNHRLFCGDATSTEDITTLLGGSFPQLVFTDPPYNVPVDAMASQ